MPELPEVERGREIAELVCRGRRIESVHCPEDAIALAGTSATKVRRALRGATVAAVGRHGKQLWFELDRRPWLLVHFGMTGAFSGYEASASSERPRFCRLELALEGGRRLAFTDPRRFGRLGLAHDPRGEPPVSRLGFDPLLGMPDARTFKALIAPRRGNVKGVLLDQSFAAGVGNWIADEVLYQAKVDPHRRVDSLSNSEIAAIRSKLASVIRVAVEAKSVSARFPKTWLFHRRWGKDASATTHDGRPLRHETIAGRTTAWVPGVQR
ncbi:MAG: Fpg/Nei family DNA glycosylase [Phycisphaerales bacterium]